MAVTAENLHQELLDLLDARAGKPHSREGRVVATLVELLNLHDELKQRGD